MKYFYEVPMGNVSDEEILEKEKIRSLVEYERYCNDYGLSEQRKALWFDDGMIFTTWFKGTAKSYFDAKPVERQGKRDEKDSHGHRVNNTVVWLNGSRAVAELLCSLNFRTKLGFEWVDICCSCRMHYRVEKRDGRWGIVYFEGIYEKDRMDPIFQDSTFAIPREQLQKYRSINWNMAARRDLFEGGLVNSEDWAGPDKPETIDRIYRQSSEWFFGPEV